MSETYSAPYSIMLWMRENVILPTITAYKDKTEQKTYHTHHKACIKLQDVHFTLNGGIDYTLKIYIILTLTTVSST